MNTCFFCEKNTEDECAIGLYCADTNISNFKIITFCCKICFESNSDIKLTGGRKCIFCFGYTGQLDFDNIIVIKFDRGERFQWIHLDCWNIHGIDLQ